MVAIVIFVLMAVSAVLGADEATNSIDVLAILQKLPTFVPFLAAKIETQECKDRLNDFKTELTSASATLGENKQSLPTMKRALCKIPNKCTLEVMGALKKMVTTGGMVEKLVKGYLDGKGVDIDTVDVLLLAYIETLCDGEGATGSGKDGLDEL